MKRFFIFLLAAFLLLSTHALAAQTQYAGEVSRGLMDILGSLLGGGEDADDGDTDQTLWSKNVSIREMELPAEAFAGESANCVGIAPDGKHFLIARTQELYLWDSESRTRVYLSPGDEITEEYMRERIALQVPAMGGAPQDASELSGRKLLNAYFAMSTGIPNYNTPGLGIPCEAPWVLILDSSGFSWLLNTETGAVIGRPNLGELRGYRDGQAMFLQVPNSYVTLVDLETDSTTEVDFSACVDFESGGRLKSASFLPDGSICAVVRSIAMDLENGDDLALVILRPDGSTETWPLGKVRFGCEPDTFFWTDAEHIVVCSRNYITTCAPYLIDCGTGQVSLLSLSGRKLAATPLEECEFDGRAMSIPGISAERTGVMIFDRMSDGQTLAVFGLWDSNILLFRPESMETQMLINQPVPVPVVYSSNHYNLIMLTRGSTYYQLDVR